MRKKTNFFKMSKDSANELKLNNNSSFYAGLWNFANSDEYFFNIRF